MEIEGIHGSMNAKLCQKHNIRLRKEYKAGNIVDKIIKDRGRQPTRKNCRFVKQN